MCWGPKGGFVYGELSGQPAWRVGSNAKYYQTQAAGKPTVVYISASHGPWVSANLTDAEIELAFCQAPVHGSGVWFYGFPWLAERPVFKKIAADYKFFSDHRDVYFGTRSRARTAIVWPAEAINFYENPSETPEARQDRAPVGNINDEFNGFYDALIKSHTPCDILDEESLRREDISRYSLLILPNAACTGKAADDRLRDYVRGGGNIIASFETSLCDESGRRQKDFGLADLFGVRLLRSPVRPYPHFYFYRNDDWAGVFSGVQAELLPAPQVSCEIAENGAKAISPFSIKFKGWDGSEILPSEFPAITVHQFGRGRAVYLAGPFGEHYWKYKQPDIRFVLGNLVRWLSPPIITLENAPETVEVAHRQTADGREVITLINYGGGLTRPFEAIDPVEDITVKLKIGDAPLRKMPPQNRGCGGMTRQGLETRPAARIPPRGRVADRSPPPAGNLRDPGPRVKQPRSGAAPRPGSGDAYFQKRIAGGSLSIVPKATAGRPTAIGAITRWSSGMPNRVLPSGVPRYMPTKPIQHVPSPTPRAASIRFSAASAQSISAVGPVFGPAQMMTSAGAP